MSLENVHALLDSLTETEKEFMARALDNARGNIDEAVSLCLGREARKIGLRYSVQRLGQFIRAVHQSAELMTA